MTDLETPADAPGDGTPTRRGGRRGHGGDAPRGPIPPQRPFAQPRMRYRPVEAVSADELEAIHGASLRILDEVGMDFLDPEARDLLKAAGARVEPGTQRVRFDPAMVEERIRTAPSEFTLHARNPEHSLRIGGDRIAFGSVGSAPNSADLDGGRRVGTRADYRNFLRLIQTFNVIHFPAGYPVEPVDIHASIRHLDAIRDILVLTDKVVHAYSLGRQRNIDAIELVKRARGIDDATLEREPSVFSIINTSSPLRLDVPMSQGMIEFSSRNQVICVTPFTLAGAMAPVTVVGALAQQNAEALAGCVLTQVVRPGSPFMYGGFTTNVDMQSGAPAFGTPEYMKAALVGGQLARRYRLPYRSSNVSTANSVDAQAAYESVFALWGAIMGGVNFLMHGAGWMEGGLHASFEKLILDADLLGMVQSFLDPLVVDEDELALDAVREVGPGGHFFGAQHTQARYRTAFYRPILSDWRNYESWQEAGSPTADRKANRIWKALVESYEEPAFEPDRREAVEDYVARRKAEGGVPTDF